jgi:hypothetical protein
LTRYSARNRARDGLAIDLRRRVSVLVVLDIDVAGRVIDDLVDFIEQGFLS